MGGGSPAGAAGSPPAPYAGSCPVVGANQMPPSANEPLPGQVKPLSTWRQHSNIPTGSSAVALPPHQQPVRNGEVRGVHTLRSIFGYCVLGYPEAPFPILSCIAAFSSSTGVGCSPQECCTIVRMCPGQRKQVWVYPSEQMFYNAMKRKGWTPSEDDMAAVVAIHNAGTWLALSCKIVSCWRVLWRPQL